MSDDLYGLPLDKIPTLVHQIEEADDGWRKMQPLDEAGISWGDRHQLLWALVRRGDYAAWDDPLVWSELSSEAGMSAANAQDIVEFLSKVTTFDGEAREGRWIEDDIHGSYFTGDQPGYRPARLARRWPLDLDTMAMHAYAADADLVEAQAPSFSEDIQQGLDYVRRRFQVLDADQVTPDMVQALASVDLWEGLHGPIWDVQDGQLTALKTNYTGQEKQRARQRSIGHFADDDTWGRAILQALDEDREGTPKFDSLLPAWPLADADDLPHLLEHISFNGDGPDQIYAIMAQRDDDPQHLFDIARHFADANQPTHAEFTAVCAILGAHRRDEPIADDALEMITFQALSRPYERVAPSGFQPLIEALRAVGEDAAVPRYLELFQADYFKTRPLVGLAAFPDSEPLLSAAFELIADTASDQYGFFDQMDDVVRSLSLAGPALLDRLNQAFDAADHPVLRDTYRRAIIAILADADEPADPIYDPVISLVDLEEQDIREENLRSQLLKDYLTVLQAMEEERALDLIDRDIDVDAPAWPRMIGVLQHFQQPAIIAKLMGLIAHGHSTEVGGYDWFGDIRQIYHDHRDTLEPHLAQILAHNDEADLHNQIRNMVGAETYDELLQSAGADGQADADQVAKIRRLAETYFQAMPDAPRRTIYAFDSDEAPKNEDSLSRIGGRPPGVDADTWPHKNGDADLPMTHLFTLDLRDVPGIAAPFQDEARALSLFVRSPGANKAWEAHNADSEVRVISDDDAQPFDGDVPVGGDDPGQPFGVQALEVPDEAFTVEYGTNPALEAIKNAIYQLNAWGGSPFPIWLQSAQYHGTFILQFDEGFIPINLGDCGIMYVFADTAFWQCH